MWMYRTRENAGEGEEKVLQGMKGERAKSLREILISCCRELRLNTAGRLLHEQSHAEQCAVTGEKAYLSHAQKVSRAVVSGFCAQNLSCLGDSQGNDGFPKCPLRDA